MGSKTPWLWIVGGPNGAGKTTFCRDFLPLWVETYKYLNADLMAAGLSPLDPSRAPISAGRLMLQQIEAAAKARETFAVETTLSGGTYFDLALKLKRQGWKVGVVYLWLRSDKIALDRVAKRVLLGGHSIPDETVIRRRVRGHAALPKYLKLADQWLAFDNSGAKPDLVAAGQNGNNVNYRPMQAIEMGLL